MGTTNLDGFENANQALGVEEMTLVYEGNPTLGGVADWQEFVLDAPYEYDDTQNLAVVICCSSWDWNSDVVYATTGSKGALYRGSTYYERYASLGYQGEYNIQEVPLIRFSVGSGHALQRGDVNGNGALNIVDAQIAYDMATNSDMY